MEKFWLKSYPPGVPENLPPPPYRSVREIFHVRYSRRRTTARMQAIPMGTT